MSPNNFFTNIRRPGKEDFLQVLGLMHTCGIHEYGESDADEVDLQFDWDQMNLEKDAWIGTDKNGNLTGYAAAVPFSMGVRFDLSVHPQILDPAAGEFLLGKCIERAQENFTAEKKSVRAVTYIAAVNERDRTSAEKKGFLLERSHYQMRLDMDKPPAAVSVPNGYELRTFNRDDLDERYCVYSLVQAAFERPGRQPQAYESWIESMQRSDIFDPSLWFLLLHNGKIAGVSLCFLYPGLGWVRQLAVDKELHGKGLGSLLLRHSFWEFWQRGYPHAGLGVASDNTHALEFYLRLGMHIKRQYCEYQKIVSNP